MWKNRWKNEFYTRLEDVLDSRSAHTVLIVNENMKAKVGDQNWDHERAMGNHGLEEINDNSERLCETFNTRVTMSVPIRRFEIPIWIVLTDNSAHNRFQQRILYFRWEDHVRTEELLERARKKLLFDKVKLIWWWKMIGYILG